MRKEPREHMLPHPGGGKDDCDEWCMELCEVQMDDIIERIAADVRASISVAS